MRRKREWMQFIKFNLVGLLNTAIDWIVYTILVACGVPLAVSQTIGYSAGVLNSYVCNLRFTFGEKSSMGVAVKFFAVNLLILLLSVGLLRVLNEALGCNWLVSKLLLTPATLALNYLFNRLWVFKNK